ncbi:hypothetical protein [Paenibacillus motobuensis]|uniref:Uncharacterized protein n=1 Tax=Paenibacillus motobuensis TaxID=295324 RepID=A0ABP3HZT6_9BACL
MMNAEFLGDEICPCCGFHFGFNDDGVNKEDSYYRWREKWVADGCIWFSKSRRPHDTWNPVVQLKKMQK